MTLNFIRSLSAGGFADVHHPEQWELPFFRRAKAPDSLREEYERTTRKLAEALRFMEALGEMTVEELTRVDFYTSHEGLNLHYESAQTRSVPRRDGLLGPHDALPLDRRAHARASTAPTSSSSAASRTRSASSSAPASRPTRCCASSTR